MGSCAYGWNNQILVYLNHRVSPVKSSIWRHMRVDRHVETMWKIQRYTKILVDTPDMQNWVRQRECGMDYAYRYRGITRRGIDDISFFTKTWHHKDLSIAIGIPLNISNWNSLQLY